MRIKSVQANLARAVTLAEKVSGKNLTLPVLNCIFLKADHDTLTLKATNLDIGIEVSLGVAVEEGGEVAVPAGVFAGALAALPTDALLELSLESGNLKIKTKSGVSTLKAQPHDDFPTIPHPTDGVSFGIKPETVIEGIRAVWYSASVSGVKPELSSIYCAQYNKKLLFVATDSFRLAEKAVTPAVALPDFDPILIPVKNIPEILRALERAEQDVAVRVNENQISFSFDGVYLVSRLTDATFPDYRQIIPKGKTTEAVVLKQDLVDTLKKTSIFSDTFNHISFIMDPPKKRFMIASKNSDVGETEDSLNAALSGEPLTISFNHKYLTDAFQSIHGDSISLSLSGSGKPMVLRGVSDTSFLYLVMPMNR